MTFKQLLESKNLTSYHLSKLSFVPVSTIDDLVKEKSNIYDCKLRTILNIASAFHMTIDEFISSIYDNPLQNKIDSKTGKPIDKSYLEYGLPIYLQTSINNMIAGKEKVKHGEDYSLYDCDFCDVQASINCAQVDGDISEEQAWFLREKYLGMRKEDNT